tara:strand:+ start:5491 stop:6054 length:564 start_codon:yes stop_codon:yes gene_type:complete
MKNNILLFIPFLALSLGAQEYEELKKCSSIKEQMERLACYDQIAESLVGEENKITVKPDQDTPIVAKEIKAKDQNVAIIEEDEQTIKGQRERIISLERMVNRLTRQRNVEREKNESKYQPFSAEIISVSFVNYKFKFKLDNDETWRLTDSGKRARLKKGDNIKIEPGEMDSFFLVNSKGRFRVKKVK